MAYTQGQIDDLRAAIAEGVLEVRSGDRTVKYRSLDEMRSILREMEASVTGDTSAAGLRIGRRYAQFQRD